MDLHLHIHGPTHTHGPAAGVIGAGLGSVLMYAGAMEEQGIDIFKVCVCVCLLQARIHELPWCE
jgi:hypothetical protein